MDITQTQLTELIKILQNDGFINIKKHPTFVSFQTLGGYRYFELSDLNLDHLVTSLNMELILQNFYKEKTRYSQAIDTNSENKDNFEEICEKLEWIIDDCLGLISSKFDTRLDIDTNLIYEISIDGLTHIMYNDQVFEGSLSVIRQFIEEPLYKVLKDKKILHFLKES